MNYHVVVDVSLAFYQFISISCQCGASRCFASVNSIHKIKLFSVFHRDCKSNDSCDQPGDVNVLGDVQVVCNGNNG